MKEKNWYLKYLLIKIIYIIIIPIIIYDIVLIGQTIINPETIPNIFGYKSFNIVSDSMTPTVEKNDLIFVKVVEQPELKIGDIVSFKLDGEIITHRITNIEGRKGVLIYTTKGDNNEIEDVDKIEYNDIEGKYMFKIPHLGNILSLFKNTIVFIFILIILIISYLYEKNKVSKKINRKKKRRKWEREKVNTEDKEKVFK